MTTTALPDTAVLYDWECRHVLHRGEQDVSFWRELSGQSGGPVLELACGTGRITLPLAAEGVSIIGLDNDPVMLAAARRRQSAPEARTGARTGARSGSAFALFLAGDMRRFALARRFALVFVAYNSLQLLTEGDDMLACLDLARRHLVPGGLVGLEVTDFQVGGADGTDDAGADGPFPLAEAEGISLSGSLIHDLTARTSQYRRHFEGGGEGGRWAVDDQITMRSLDAGELDAILGGAGLTLARRWVTGPTIRAVATM